MNYDTSILKIINVAVAGYHFIIHNANDVLKLYYLLYSTNLRNFSVRGIYVFPLWFQIMV